MSERAFSPAGLNETARRFPRTLAQAFGPHTSHTFAEPARECIFNTARQWLRGLWSKK